jgi:hypothetical protein
MASLGSTKYRHGASEEIGTRDEIGVEDGYEFAGGGL